MSREANGDHREPRDSSNGAQRPSLVVRFFHILGRPWSWAVIALVALVAAPMLYVQYSITRIPVVGPPFDVAAHKATKVDRSKNAFVDYLEAGRSYEALSRVLASDPKRMNAAAESSDKAMNEGWSFANDDVRKWVERNQGALSIWRRGTEQVDAIEVPLDELTINALLPGTQSLREFTRLALLEASRLTDEGKSDEAWQWIRATLRSSRHVGMHSTAIGRLVGIAMFNMSEKPIQRWAASPETTSDELRRALNDLESIRAMTPPVSGTIKNEYLMIRQTPVAEIPDMQSERTQWMLRLTGLIERNRRTDDILFANWLSQCDMPRFQRTPAASKRVSGLYEPIAAAAHGEPVAQTQEIEGWMLETRSFASMLGAKYLSLAPAVDQIIEATDREAMRLAGLQLSLALQLYYREHGEFPEKLEQLLGNDLKVIPADPFGKGESMRYRRDADPKAGATVWSLGVDGTDQEGRIEQTQEGPKLTEFDEVFQVRPPQSEKQKSATPEPAK